MARNTELNRQTLTSTTDQAVAMSNDEQPARVVGIDRSQAPSTTMVTRLEPDLSENLGGQTAYVYPYIEDLQLAPSDFRTKRAIRLVLEHPGLRLRLALPPDALDAVLTELEDHDKAGGNQWGIAWLRSPNRRSRLRRAKDLPAGWELRASPFDRDCVQRPGRKPSACIHASALKEHRRRWWPTWRCCMRCRANGHCCYHRQNRTGHGKTVYDLQGLEAPRPQTARLIVIQDDKSTADQRYEIAAWSLAMRDSHYAPTVFWVGQELDMAFEEAQTPKPAVMQVTDYEFNEALDHPYLRNGADEIGRLWNACQSLPAGPRKAGNKWRHGSVTSGPIVVWLMEHLPPASEQQFGSSRQPKPERLKGSLDDFPTSVDEVDGPLQRVDIPNLLLVLKALDKSPDDVTIQRHDPGVRGWQYEITIRRDAPWEKLAQKPMILLSDRVNELAEYSQWLSPDEVVEIAGGDRERSNTRLLEQFTQAALRLRAERGPHGRLRQADVARACGEDRRKVNYHWERFLADPIARKAIEGEGEITLEEGRDQDRRSPT